MKGLVGGPLLVGSLGPGPPAPPPLNPALARLVHCLLSDHIHYTTRLKWQKSGGRGTNNIGVRPPLRYLQAWGDASPTSPRCLRLWFWYGRSTMVL